ncbi:MAG: transposase [Deltaproteobacteria bacterium]|jgi:putative transposase|nr:transposase [Deltaproteobacteria bacterium]MBT4641948.1 transposase [Deltaproteobacteria bacterium]MBT6498488.1 transposase [Deltaproteobacteria bacterium]MBT6613357.1 transposase [Deltaproteobacteria bacterium]MBT7155392.1 transposase [Deltaproteobacteria bacterium]
MDIFFEEDDRIEYISLLEKQSKRVGLTFVAYCLMTNHIHLLVIPSHEDSLRRGIGDAHRLYTRHINLRTNTRGHLFQGRFYSCPLDGSHFLAAARYVERNPVRAKICERAEMYRWSSASYHLGISKKDPLIKTKYQGIGSPSNWSKWLGSEPAEIETLRHHFRVGRPIGSAAFIKQAELMTGRTFTLQKAGRPKVNA